MDDRSGTSGDTRADFCGPFPCSGVIFGRRTLRRGPSHPHLDVDMNPKTFKIEMSTIIAEGPYDWGDCSGAVDISAVHTDSWGRGKASFR